MKLKKGTAYFKSGKNWRKAVAGSTVYGHIIYILLMKIKTEMINLEYKTKLKVDLKEVIIYNCYFFFCQRTVFLL